MAFSFALRFCSPGADEHTALFHEICDVIRQTCGVDPVAQEDRFVDENDDDDDDDDDDSRAAPPPTRGPVVQRPPTDRCGLVGRASVNFCDPLGDDSLSILRAYCHWMRNACSSDDSGNEGEVEP
jgi:hypothetical protein